MKTQGEGEIHIVMEWENEVKIQGKHHHDERSCIKSSKK
jgi:hypothetical protein